MHVAVDETLAVGARAIHDLRVVAERLPTLLYPRPAPAHFAASPAWLDAAESAELRDYGKNLDRLLSGVRRALSVSPSVRRRVAPRPAALMTTWRQMGRARALSLAQAPSLLRLHTGPSTPEPVLATRSDGFFIEGRYRVFEINGGIRAHRFVDVMAETFAENPPFAEMLDGKEPARTFASLAAAIAKRHERLASGESSAVVLLRAEGPIDLEHGAFFRALEEAGVPAHHAVVRALRWDGHSLTVDSRRATALVDVGERAALSGVGAAERVRCSLLALRAHRAGKTLLFPVPYTGVFSKILIARLSDGTFDGHVDPVALETMRRTLVWTRLTEPGETTCFDGSRGDLRRLCAQHRRDLLLKPLAGIGGQGVVLGDETEDADWTRRLARAFADSDHVVQERLRPAPFEIALVDPPAARRRVIADICPVVIDGHVASVASRFADNPVTNLTANTARRARCFGLLPVWMTPP